MRVGGTEEKEKGMDMIWYIWTAPNSPIYGRHKMATFERYFLEEKEMHHYWRMLNLPAADSVLWGRINMKRT